MEGFIAENVELLALLFEGLCAVSDSLADLVDTFESRNSRHSDGRLCVGESDEQEWNNDLEVLWFLLRGSLGLGMQVGVGVAKGSKAYRRAIWS